MKYLITGGSGFVGQHLSKFLLNQGDEVIAIGLRPSQEVIRHEKFQYISADTSKPGIWQDAVNEAEAVINLAGKNIFKRWTESYKQLIYDSRILTTRNLVEALPENENRILLSASAVGYYGNRADEILTEDSKDGTDFLAKVARDWEAQALSAKKKRGRVVTARFGIVLGKGGGAIAKMVPAFKSFAGGPIGNVMQWFSWIHIEDLLCGLKFVAENNAIEGPVNFTSPNPVRNKEFAKTLGKVLRRPAMLSVPGFMIRLLMGEFGETLLSGQRAMPEKLLKHGFQFRFASLEDALGDLLAPEA
ncbi:MAG: TIGR01777 family oxidoreductase [Deltaproteobacteria bacterium]|nr:TIGR01777 family oxidoreductase [Deltaproteobacteria bacterium]